MRFDESDSSNFRYSMFTVDSLRVMLFRFPWYGDGSTLVKNNTDSSTCRMERDGSLVQHPTVLKFFTRASARFAVRGALWIFACNDEFSERVERPAYLLGRSRNSTKTLRAMYTRKTHVRNGACIVYVSLVQRYIERHIDDNRRNAVLPLVE